MSNARYAFALLSLMFVTDSFAEQVTIAVASNFAAPATDIVRQFELATGAKVRVATASTGKLYAQIVNGAPFDILLAADAERPRLLEESGIGIGETRETYAIGRLYLYSRHESFAGVECEAELKKIGKRRLAIANPLTAPYGRAAQEYLEAGGVLSAVTSRLVFGENIAQTFLFVATGNAEVGLVANSQLATLPKNEETCRVAVSPKSHAPIEQQAILLQRASGNEMAAEFLDYLGGPESRKILTDYLYGLP